MTEDELIQKLRDEAEQYIDNLAIGRFHEWSSDDVRKAFFIAKGSQPAAEVAGKSEDYAQQLEKQRDELQEQLAAAKEAHRKQAAKLKDKKMLLRKEMMKLVDQHHKLLVAIKHIIRSHENNSGYEPSLSVFQRSIDEAREIVARCEVQS